jgi:hypothetical protein
MRQNIDLNKGEKIESVLSPHPLSFMKLQAVCIFIVAWGIVTFWLADYSAYKSIFHSNPWFPVILWGIVLLIVGVIIALISIRWSIFFLYLAVFLGGIGILVWQNLYSSVVLFILIWSAIAAIIGFLCVEVYRRSHQYLITNQRLVFSGGIFTKRTRFIKYDKITEFNSEQGVLGQILGFGTIIPVSESGLGLGSDKTFAGAGVGGGSRLKVFGFAGGGKDVNTPRTRSYYELYGVYPFKDVLKMVNEHHQETDITPYQKEQVEFQRQQVDIQKQMRDLLKNQHGGGGGRVRRPQASDEEELEEPEEEPEPRTVKTRRHKPQEAEPEGGQAFGKDQVDIQEQMKELLKKQRTIRAAPVEVDDPQEKEDGDEAEAEEKPGSTG